MSAAAAKLAITGMTSDRSVGTCCSVVVICSAVMLLVSADNGLVTFTVCNAAITSLTGGAGIADCTISRGAASGHCNWFVNWAAILLVSSLDVQVGANAVAHVEGTAVTFAAADTSTFTALLTAGAAAAAKLVGICTR